GIEVEGGEGGKLEVVGGQRSVAAAFEVLRENRVQAHAFSLGQAGVGDVFQRRVAKPPMLRPSGLGVAHDDLGVLELLQLFDRGLGIDDCELAEVERVNEDGGAARQL